MFGLAGTLVASPHVQASLWAIDGVGLVPATSLLALKHFRDGSDIAGDFLVFATGEGVLLSGTAHGPAGSVSRQLPPWRRMLGAVAAVLFAMTAARI